MAWWMPRGATQSPIACSAAPRFLSAREIASVEQLPIDRTTVGGSVAKLLFQEFGSL
jgi:hypothetical protein